MSAPQTSRTIEETQVLAPAPALTGCRQPEDRARALDAGFNALLVKPMTPEDLQIILAGRVQ